MLRPHVIAMVCHEVARGYRSSISDHTQPPWEDVCQADKDRKAANVDWLVARPWATPASLHERWVRERIGEGWKFGLHFDKDEKLDPLVCAFYKLPFPLRVLDHLFLATVRAMAEVD